MFETLEFYVGQEVDFAVLPKRLSDFGYTRRDKISAPGEFSVRGGVVDVFPLNFSMPIRMEFSADTLESIHVFDTLSGARLEPHTMVIVLKIRAWQQNLVRNEGLLSVDTAAPIDPFVDIEPGDLVVHVLHGIARYRGIQSLKNKQDKQEDHFVLEFADKNILYVPTRDMHLVQRYIAFGKIKPGLSRLGSRNWERLKEKTKKGVLSFAAELLDMQVKRKALQGLSFQKDTEWQRKLEEEFPYEETEDQVRALEEVKKDLESPVPMDRLLCGDVGYGKTEVALRAAFKAVMSGKQVAILVPTTILAEQHFDTFGARMKSFPVKIHMLSRFQTKLEQRKIVEQIAEGASDIVIGTHRLLSKDISFKDLGLVIIDEEQRFGVKHKEHLKRLRLLVDILTLTATPIPRTLYLSLVGTKDMSTINTPPRNRKPIQTVVKETDDCLIRDAILRELARKGQLFFIHNRVESIEAAARKVSKLVPEAKIAFAHGQMPGKLLESIMHKFIHGQIDVLVSTTIVESGIDIPNANTLIVDRADLFGLSELYQLRGRVGRFDRNAFAYFLVPKGMVLTEESRKRLEAIQRFTYLGSGFNLAMEDLEIRGAGNILGTEQHGYISSIGFDLYCRILKETVSRLSKSA
ncbi:MAG: transcription-repair coupling factor [Omnitrophica bacterium RIFCSPHIGHO2_02_FULL_51_18]|nr:MAG: transcription-repair coupling factor [Omnitrophica bacterium RIFCSPHIGHO2_02_FULL_51_18]